MLGQHLACPGELNRPSLLLVRPCTWLCWPGSVGLLQFSFQSWAVQACSCCVLAHNSYNQVAQGLFKSAPLVRGGSAAPDAAKTTDAAKGEGHHSGITSISQHPGLVSLLSPHLLPPTPHPIMLLNRLNNRTRALSRGAKTAFLQQWH